MSELTIDANSNVFAWLSRRGLHLLDRSALLNEVRYICKSKSVFDWGTITCARRIR